MSSSWPFSWPSSPDRRGTGAWLRYAKLPFHKIIEDLDFDFQPSVDHKLIEDLATLRFIGENRPVLFLGQPGCAKTHCRGSRDLGPSRPATGATARTRCRS